MSQLGSSSGFSVFSAFRPPSGSIDKTGSPNPPAEEGSSQGAPAVSTIATTSVFGANNTPAPESLLLSADLRLSASQMSRLLRNLLQLPPEIAEFLALLAYLEETSASKPLQTLLGENLLVSLEELQTLLLERLAQSEEKLMKLLQSAPITAGASRDGATLSPLELLRIRRELAIDAGRSPIEAFRTLVVLYLPAYPLHIAQGFLLRFPASGRKTDEEPADEQESGEEATEGKPNAGQPATEWLVTIRTVSLGSFSITLSVTRITASPASDRPAALSGQACLSILIVHGAEAAPALEEIRTELESMMAADHLPTSHLIFKQRTTLRSHAKNPALTVESANPEDERADAPTVNVRSANTVPAAGLQWTYRLIRLILDLDNKHRTTARPTGS